MTDVSGDGGKAVIDAYKRTPRDMQGSAIRNTANGSCFHRGPTSRAVREQGLFQLASSVSWGTLSRRAARPR